MPTAAPQRSRPSESLHALRILDRLLDVLDGDEALQPEVVIDDEELLDFLLMQDLARFVERRADRHRDEVLLRHHVGHGPLDVGLEAQVAVGEDADEPAFLAAVFGDRHAGDAVLAHQLQRFADATAGRERDRVDDHAALGPLDAIDFERLLVDRQVLVDDAQAAVLRHGDGHLGLGDRVHGGAQERHVQRDVAGQPGRDVDLRRHHGGMPWHEQDVVERERGPETGGERVGGAEASNFVWAIWDYMQWRFRASVSDRILTGTGPEPDAHAP